VTDEDWLAGRFEGNRARLRAMAYRMLGSANDAEDAVQEAWLRASGAGADGVANLDGWLTTIVARVCLDMLRARKARPEQAAGGGDGFDPATLRGAAAVAHGARLAAGRSRESVLALVDGVPGIMTAPGGQVAVVLAFGYRGDRIAAIEVIADPGRLGALELAVLG
jgi:DNA-directed RNA polymerase specialized sigma24 family protein